MKQEALEIDQRFCTIGQAGREDDLTSQMNPDLSSQDRRVGTERITGLIQRARDNAGEMTYIESIISAGRENIMVVSLSNRSVFEEEVPAGWAWGSMEGAEIEEVEDADSDDEDAAAVKGWSESIVGTMKSVLGY